MTAKEQTLWEQAVRVLRQNSVIPTVAVDTPRADSREGSKQQSLAEEVSLRPLITRPFY